MNEQEEATMIQAIWGTAPKNIFDRLLLRNFFHVHKRPAEDLPAYLRREPTAHLAIVACSDCQVDPNDIFQLRPGEAIILQNGGNVSNPDLIRSLIVAVFELGVNFIVVLGHVNCSFKNLDVGHLEMSTSKKANINAKSFGFDDPRVFYRPIDDVLEHVRQQANILQTHPLFRNRIEILPMLYDDAKGFVYNVNTLSTKKVVKIPAKTIVPESRETQLVIKADTPKQIAAEIEKLFVKFPGNNSFVLKVLRNWQWDKYIEEQGIVTRNHSEEVVLSRNIADLLKGAEVEKLATLSKIIQQLQTFSPHSPSIPAPEPRVLHDQEEETDFQTHSKHTDIAQASTMTSKTTKTISATIHAAQNAIQTQVVASVPRIVIPKINFPRPRIPRLHLSVEYPPEEKSQE